MSKIAAALRRAPGVILLTLFSVVSVNSQSSTEGLTPPALTPGMPPGSYALSGFDNINLFNGNLNFHLPLLKVAGRGGAQVPVVLKIEQRWRIEEHTPCSPCGSFFYPTYNWWTGLSVGYGPGIMEGRLMTQGTHECPDGVTVEPDFTLTKLTFTAPDGTEYEFRDKLYNGEPRPVIHCFVNGFANRGREFVTSDGTSATFISATDIIDGDFELPDYNHPTGLLILRDGTRYGVENGLIKWMQDRNGNRLAFSYDANGRVTIISDSLGRQVTFAYDLQDGSPGRFDRITYQGFGGSPRQIIVRKRNLTHALRSDQVLQTTFDLFPTLSGSTSSTFFNPQVITSVLMPNGRSYNFFYNSYGELARVVLPTGGAIEYDWAEGVEGAGGGGVWSPNVYRRVVERRTYPNAATGPSFESKISYGRQEQFVGAFQQPLDRGYVMVDQTDSAGNLLERSKHYFHGYASFAPFNPFNPGAAFLYSTPWKTGKEYKTELIDRADGVTVLRQETRTFAQREPLAWWSGPADDAPPNDPRVTETVSKWNQTNQVAKQRFSYDQFNNQTVVEEFDFGAGAPPAHPRRRTETDYVTAGEFNGIDYTGTGVHLRDLTKEHRIFSVNSGGGATLESKTHFYYDQFALTQRAGIIGWQDPLTAARGNLTSTSRWLNTTGGSVTTSQKYDVAGRVVEVTDARGNSSQIEFANASNTYAYATLIKAPVPDPTGLRGSNSQSQTVVVYDFASGSVNSITDANGQTTQAFYNDPGGLDRLTSVVRPAGGGQISYLYGDMPGNLFLQTETTQSASQTLRSTTYFDGLGRSIRTSQSEGGTTIESETKYDALGRISEVSNPYRAGDTVHWTITQYDVLGRVWKVTKPGGAQTTNAYSGNSVTVTDPAGKVRLTVSDALGRVTSVTEDPGGFPHLNLQTSYTYDSQNNLRKVTQGSQARYFMYDSLSRLIRAKNPEQDSNGSLFLNDPVTGNSQWSLALSYDNSGNVLSRTDARNITCNNTYDQINRPLTRTYSNDPNQTPPADFRYDGAGVAGGVANSRGRLTAANTSGPFASSYTYDSFDALGRVLHSTQITDGQQYQMSYEYDFAGNLIRQTYPSQRVVESGFDAAGRISTVSSGATVYLSSVNYYPHGGVKDLKLGNNLWEHTIFNERLQPTQIRLGTTQSAFDRLRLTYDYGATNNNGDVLSHTITVPSGPTLTQNFTYDGLNRLEVAQENGGTSWKQKFLYDRYGNRTIDPANTSPAMVGPNPAIDSARNRINAVGYEYDFAGNLTRDGAGHTYEYDADNMQVKYDNGAARYFYDGRNERVKTVTNNGALTTIFVYDAMGKLVAEYTNTTPGGGGTSYLTSDALGSPRIITGAGPNPAVKARHDYLPFGEEIGPGVGGRSSGQGYVADTVRQKFTGKQRDVETGLDYFKARYYASAQGRFSSADTVSGSASNPQSFNLYAYVLNNPLALVDPTGHAPAPLMLVDYFDDAYQRSLHDDGTREPVWNEAAGPAPGVQHDPVPKGEKIMVAAITKQIREKRAKRIVIFVAGINNPYLADAYNKQEAAGEFAGVDKTEVAAVTNNHTLVAALEGAPNLVTAKYTKQLIEVALNTAGYKPHEIILVAHSNGVPSLEAALSKISPTLKFGGVYLLAPNTSDITVIQNIVSRANKAHVGMSPNDNGLHQPGIDHIPAEGIAAGLSGRQFNHVEVYKYGNVEHAFTEYNVARKANNRELIKKATK